MRTLYTRLHWSILILCVLGLAAALISQHWANMRPCAWCVFQRLILLVMAGVTVANLWCQTRFRLCSKILTGISALLAGSGILAAWYQYSVAAQQFSCAQTFADWFMTASGLSSAAPWLFGIYATCMDARVKLLGIEYALWALALFVVLAALAITALFTKQQDQTP